MSNTLKDLERMSDNADPITGEPGAHPVGAGIGAAGMGAAGAAIGSLGGPVGTVVGAAVGGIVGGLAGKSAAEAIDPTAEDAYWRSNYSSRPYVEEGAHYETYQPAYRFGWESRSQNPDRHFDDIEPDLRTTWERAQSGMEWERARPAMRDAWDRPNRDR